MTVYKTGRSSDYLIAPAEKPSKPKTRPLNYTDDAIAQFERMARGYMARCSEGAAIIWVQDDTITPDQREWCRQTAQQIKRSALAKLQRRAQEPPTRTTAQVEQAVAAALARRPDATAHEVRMITGIAHSRVLRTEAWICAHMGKAATR